MASDKPNVLRRCLLKCNGITTAIVASCLMICSAHNSIAKSILLHACETQSPTQVAKLRLMKLALSSKGRIESGAGASLKIACANKESCYLKNHLGSPVSLRASCNPLASQPCWSSHREAFCRLHGGQVVPVPGDWRLHALYGLRIEAAKGM